MNSRGSMRLSGAMPIAVIALLIALGGTAGAAVTAAVPLAKRALIADNAKKLRGQTPAEIASRAASAALAVSPGGPRPASTVQQLVTVRMLSAVIPAGAPIDTLYVVCNYDERVLGGGFSASAPVLLLASYPEDPARWTVRVSNPDPAASVSVTASATCTK